MLKLPSVSSALPVLVTVTSCVTLVVPVVWLPKVMVAGLRVTRGVTPPAGAAISAWICVGVNATL